MFPIAFFACYRHLVHLMRIGACITTLATLGPERDNGSCYFFFRSPTSRYPKSSKSFKQFGVETPMVIWGSPSSRTPPHLGRSLWAASFSWFIAIASWFFMVRLHVPQIVFCTNVVLPPTCIVYTV